MKILTCFLILVFSSFICANDLYVKSKYANLQKHPQKKDGMKKIKRGEALLKIRKVRDWYNVEHKGKKWWVYKGKLSPRAPRKDLSLISPSYADNAAVSNDRKRNEFPSKYARSRDIKPKYEQFMKYHQSFMTSDRENLTTEITSDGIQPVQITTEMLEKFQEDGKIGAYANSGDGSEFETED